MIQWDDIRVFLALSTSGTQKAAARSLQVDQATVGRRIREFERALGTKLFDKRSDGWVLTSAGSAVLERAHRAEAAIFDLQRSTASLDQKPKGTIRIAMPGGMANHWLIPRLKPFFAAYPDIQTEFLTGPEVVNLWKRQADVAIRLVEPVQKDLYVKKLGEIRLAVYSAKPLPVSRGKSPLAGFAFIGLFESAMSGAERSLIAKLGPIGKVVCRSHAWSSIYYAVRAGLGAGILPSFFAENDPNLGEFKTLPSVSTPVWLVMHPDVKGSARTKAFTGFLSTLV